MAFHGLFSIDDISLLEDRYQDIPDDDENFFYRICQDFDSGTLEDAGLTHSNIESWRRISLNTCHMLLTYRAEGKVRRYDVFTSRPLIGGCGVMTNGPSSSVSGTCMETR